MHLALPHLWESTIKLVENSQDWTGWFLAFVAMKCYPERRQAGGKKSYFVPFRYKNRSRSYDLLLEFLQKIGLVVREAQYSVEAEEESFSSGGHLNSDNDDDNDSNHDSDDEKKFLWPFIQMVSFLASLFPVFTPFRFPHLGHLDLMVLLVRTTRF
jgi:hypothetical protein